MECIQLEDIFKNDDGTTTFTPDEIQAYRNEYQRVNDSSASAKDKADGTETLNKLVIEQKKKANRIAMEEVLKDMRFNKTLAKAIEAGAKPIDAFYALIDSSTTHFEGAKDSAQSTRERIINQNAQIIYQYKSQHKLGKFFEIEYEDLVADAHYDMHINKLSDSELLAKYADTPEVIKVAEAYTKIMSNALKELHDAGIEVSAREGYLGRQTYSTEKVMETDASRARFKQVMYENINWEETLPEVLSNGIVDQKAAMDYLHGVVESMDNSVGRGSILRFRKQRKIQFKDSRAWLQVSKEFGYADTLNGNVIGTLTDVAKRVGMYEKLGIDPKAKLQSLMNQHLPSNQRKKVETLFDAYQGTGVVPEGVLYRGLTTGTRFMSIALLQKATFTAVPTDIVSAAHTLYQTGAVDSIASGYMSTIKNYLSLVGNKKKQIEVASQYMHYLENAQQAASRYMFQEAPRGKFGQFYDMSFSASGLTGHTNAMKLASVMNFADNMLFQLQRGSKGADAAEFLSAFNLGDVEIQALKRIQGGKLTGAALDELNLDGLEIPMHMTPDRFRSTLKSKMGKVYSEVAQMAAPTPGLKERVSTGFGTDINSIQGQILRISTQFYGTSFKGFNDMLYLNSIKDKSPVSSAGFIAQRIAGMMVTGYIINQLKNFVYDKDTVAPQDIGPKEIALYMQQANLIPMLGDAIFGMIAYGQASPSDVMVGPLAQVAGTGLQKTQSKLRKMIAGKQVDFTDSDIHYLKSLTPMINLPIVQGPMTLVSKMLED